ncbi:MAG: hypothetical protein PHS47_05620 [Methanocellales archaeon]|nr:hypothetical protein [Methanocellales archaeon]
MTVDSMLILYAKRMCLLLHQIKCKPNIPKIHKGDDREGDITGAPYHGCLVYVYNVA